MEILVTIVAFWLVLIGAYGAYSFTQDRHREPDPEVRPGHPMPIRDSRTADGPFRPVNLPSETVPGFIATAVPRAPRREETPARLPVPVGSQPLAALMERQTASMANAETEPTRRGQKFTPTPLVPRFRPPARPAPSEIDFLRAQVEHLRGEINALSTERLAGPARRARQRRYRPGIYTHLPRTLQRQVNEARGVRRFKHN